MFLPSLCYQFGNIGIFTTVMTCKYFLCQTKTSYLQNGNFTEEDKNVPNFEWKFQEHNSFPSNCESFLLVHRDILIHYQGHLAFWNSDWDTRFCPNVDDLRQNRAFRKAHTKPLSCWKSLVCAPHWNSILTSYYLITTINYSVSSNTWVM